MTYDPKYMSLAMEAAHVAYSSLEVPVGCVFVRNGEVIASGGNRPNASLNVRYPISNSLHQSKSY
jgi:tRNA(Arg) A34 adenosine deaminase TadA